MKNIQIAILCFLAGFALAVISMVLGPLGWVTACIASAVVAAALSLTALFFALRAHRDVHQPHK